MKTKLIILACILLLPPAVTFSAAHTLADETRAVRGFTGLSVSGSFDVDVQLGNTESVRIEGDANVIRDIETVVENGTLHVRVKRGVRFDSRNTRGLKVYVSAIQLENVGLSGSGKVHVAGVLSGNELNLYLSGSGRIEATTRVDEANVNVSGSGVVSLTGESNETNVRVSGSGRIDGANLKSVAANVRISGSGGATVHAEKTLATTISGSGNVRYSGNPEVTLVKSGSGSLTKL